MQNNCPVMRLSEVFDIKEKLFLMRDWSVQHNDACKHLEFLKERYPAKTKLLLKRLDTIKKLELDFENARTSIIESLETKELNHNAH